MLIFVKALSGNTITVNDVATVNDLKAEICEREGIPEELQMLRCCGKSLSGDADLTADATVHLSLGLLGGGGKKKKKKTYTKPKKVPHKHKKVKLAVLKYYKIDD